MTMLDRRTFLAGAATAALPVAFRGRASAQAPLQTLRVAGTVSDDLTPMLYAQKMDLFAKAGIDVRFSPFANGAAIAAAVAGGAMDIGKSALVALLNAHLRGVPIVLVAPGATYSEKTAFTALVVAGNAPYRTGKDLNGKTIGVPAIGDFNTLATKMWVDKNGGDAMTLKFVEIPNAAQGPAVEEHRIDAAVIQQPDLIAALGTGKAKILGRAYGAIGSTFMFAGWFALSDFAAAHQDAVATFARVMVAAARYTNTHHIETASLLADATKIPIATIEKMSRVDCALTLNPTMIQPVIDASATYGLIAHGFAAADVIYKA